jgi:2-methylcitrate dehydratase PrpD
MARLGLALGGWHYEHGFHQTATLGVIGAAAAAAHLLAFDVDAIENTLGLAVTQAAGLRFQFGSEGKPLHAGLAARAGLFAAQLSQGGVQGAPGCLDGPLGFFSVFGGDTAVPERAVQSWGRPWQIVTPGLHFKPYPCCIGSHYAAEAALALRERHALQPGDIAAIRVTFPKGGDIPLQVRRPASGLEGRFSVEYVVAVALTEGALALAAFSDRPVRADLDGLARRVSRHYDLDGPPAAVDPTARYSVVEIELKNGAIVSQKIDRLSAAADLSTKFMDAVGGDQALRDLPQLVHTMQSAADLARLTAFFPRTGGAAEGVGGSA